MLGNMIPPPRQGPPPSNGSETPPPRNGSQGPPPPQGNGTQTPPPPEGNGTRPPRNASYEEEEFEETSFIQRTAGEELKLGPILRMTAVIMWHIGGGLWELADYLEQQGIEEVPKDAYEDFYEAEYEDDHYESVGVVAEEQTKQGEKQQQIFL